MDKIVCKTVIKTVAALVIAMVVAFVVMSLGFPQHMASMWEDVGAYRFATGYASLRYAYTNDASDLDRCARDSILSGDRDDIIKYCGKLVDDDGFIGICEKNGREYRQYIYGNLVSALYKNGLKERAIEKAQSAMEGETGFPENNALAILAIRAAAAADAETANKLLDIINNISPGDGEETYYTKVKNILTDI